MDVENNSSILVNYINNLSDFQFVESSVPYHHMGATITDALLQAGINYENVVKPRVNKIYSFQEAMTTSGYYQLLKTSGPTSLLNWHGKKVHSILAVCNLFIKENIENEKQLETWLNNELNIEKLRGIKGVGDKTLDYFKILVGIHTSAIDRHLFNFLGMAEINVNNYSKAQEIIHGTAVMMQISESLLDHSIWKYMSGRAKAGNNTRKVKSVNVGCFSRKQKEVSDNKVMENKKQFGEFVDLLKELRERGKISAEELRDYRKNWENNPQNRKILTDDLSTKLTKYS